MQKILSEKKLSNDVEYVSGMDPEPFVTHLDSEKLHMVLDLDLGNLPWDFK
jgi:hypothetical protein